MAHEDLGANEFSFSGDRTQISYSPVSPGPIHPGQRPGRLSYSGPEGSIDFTGDQITHTRSPLGTLLTVTLSNHPDAGAILATVLVPHITGVTREAPVTFETLLVKTTGRGFIATPGADQTYSIVPLLGTAKDVILPAVAGATTEA